MLNLQFREFKCQQTISHIQKQSLHFLGRKSSQLFGMLNNKTKENCNFSKSKTKQEYGRLTGINREREKVLSRCTNKKKKTVKKNPADSTECDLVVFFNMAPKKVKTQGKRNNIKIKSKVNSQNRGSKFLKKTKKDVKSIDNLKWLNKLAADGSIKKNEAVPEWLNNTTYKHKMVSPTFDDNLSERDNYPPQDAEDKSSTSDASECNCSSSKYPDNSKGGILKQKISSTNSIVTNYIKSSMNQVASFIVESALRFGKEHGVVVPDKNTPNVYEITSPDKKFEEKIRKIRFKIPEKTLTHEDEKKLIWRNNKSSGSISRRVQTPMPDRKGNHPGKSTSWESTPDSLEEILPILEKLKEEGDIVTSDLDLEKLADVSDEQSIEHHSRNKSRERDRPTERIRKRTKRFKSADATSDKTSEEPEYPPEETKWKKFRRDSLELGRRRLKSSNCPRKQKSSSPSPY